MYVFIAYKVAEQTNTLKTVLYGYRLTHTHKWTSFERRQDRYMVKHKLHRWSVDSDRLSATAANLTSWQVIGWLLSRYRKECAKFEKFCVQNQEYPLLSEYRRQFLHRRFIFIWIWNASELATIQKYCNFVTLCVCVCVRVRPNRTDFYYFCYNRHE